MGEILFVYRPYGLKPRKTITDSIFCFRHSEKEGNHVYFYDYTHNRSVWKKLSKHKFDAVIYHYTFMTLRSKPDIWQEAQNRLKKIKTGVSAAIIQDEYIYSKYTQNFLKNMDVKKVFTLARGENIRIMYPDAEADFYTVLPGYADTEALEMIAELEKELCREKDSIDIGYRARKLSYSLGRQGLLKTQIADVFNSEISKHSDLEADISTTGDTRNVFLGLDWYRFLIKCRTMLGCTGGGGGGGGWPGWCYF